tara:strand:- start:2543 stop:3385 length:843 start_codon:yes stop_codon:yes gene_type:complete
MNENVSLVIPVYNASITIKDVIESALVQTHKFDEIIVVDDSSTDNSCDIVNKFDNVLLIKNYENKGLSKSRNIGIKKSKNNIIACIDSDVLLEKFWLEKIIKFLKSDDTVLCGGKLIEKYLANNYNNWRALRYKQNWGNSNITNPPFIFGCNFVLFKTSWEKVNGFNEELKTNGEDIDYSIKIRESGLNTKYCHEAICYHLQNDSIISLSKIVWRYHSFGYKVKKISFLRLLKLVIKQFNFLIKRILQDLLRFRFIFIYINIVIFFNFIFFEFLRLIKKK